MFRKQLKRNLQIMEDGGEPMNVFHTSETLRAPVEKVKFGLRAATRYVPPEAGDSKAVPDIEKVLATWVGYESASE